MQDSYNETTVIDATNSGVAWQAIFAGAIASVSLTMLMFPLGSALGLAGAHSMPNGTADGTDAAKALTLASVIWLIVVQWLSSGFGGYLTGRLRTKWAGAHTHEVFFRDTAHGFLSWGVATLFLTFIVMAVAAPMLGGRMHGLMMHGQDDRAQVSDNAAYQGRNAARPAPAATAPVSMTEEDRKAAAKASLFLFVSMLIGAFIATAAAALGGRHRDVHYRYGRLVE